MPSSTDISNSLISFLGTTATKPNVGFGAVGIKILQLSSLVEAFSIKSSESRTKNAIIYISRRGNSTNTTFEKELPVEFLNESSTCFVAL